MFSDTVNGANASANLYTLVESAKANGIDPYRCLTWLFLRLPLARAAEDYDALLPGRCQSISADRSYFWPAC
ncbi:transposase domain-containing protein [Caballeronia sp. LZ029]|uniref:transposase domain-containing protein n=1 Tax=Caballeronia sp. LZ029 TaxID=3038564 RepID=UPI003857A222